MTTRNLETHIRIVAWLNIANALLSLFIGVLALLLLLTGFSLFAGDVETLPFVIIGGLGIGLLMFVLALPSLLAGVGLLRQRNWGRLLAIIVGAFNLLSFPVGTALGLYTLWVLLQRETTDYFITPKMA